MTAAPFNPALRAAAPAPIMAARAWTKDVVFPPDRPLIDLAQAAPTDPPPIELREAMAEAALNQAGAHLYGPVLGDAALREEIAQRWSRDYGAEIRPAEVAVTSGCNQAFCAALATLAGAGDEVILPVPWYFNHKMWLDMSGARAVPLPCDDAGLPSVERAAERITDRTRALVLVTPNNPTGAEYPAELVEAFYDLAEAKGLALIVDETYRDFDSRREPPHAIFSRPGWRDRFIHLYSFSKAYRLTGHRVGAMIAGEARLAEVEKFLDTVTICASRIGQIAALEGLRTLSQFVSGERDEFLARRKALEAEFARGVGAFRLRSAGAYFAYLEHPFAMTAEDLALSLVRDQSLLTLPGTFFAPEGDADADRTLRVAYANVGVAGIAAATERLRAFAP